MISNDPLWYKDAVFYELRVGAFYDSAGRGVGDFRGLTQKLDYLQDLGVTAIWLLPFYPSPFKDDGYDISNYIGVHPAYGTLKDVKDFLSAAHERGLRVVMELVLNHTSDQHPWFQRARRSPAGSPQRDFYVWSDSPKKFKEARIIFQDFESSNWTWDPIAKAHYWHRFFFNQPDLNFDSPLVRKEIFHIVDFWMDMGVDGFRLDAVPYLFEREGTNCENLPPTHTFLRELRAHVDGKYKNRMLLAEANQWPEDAVAYFGNGDECQMAFHFPIMPRLFMAAQMEDRFPIVDILQQTPTIPDNCQWALFLRNHDELTLEMVTDEERDYMVRMYATDPQSRINVGIRRRLAPLLGNNRRKIELMNGLLFSLPGTPVIYYGDEIGMGDNIYLGDRNGVRTPMQWSPDRNAGFSRANSQKLYLPIITDAEYHYEALNVESQQANPHSLLWWMKRFIVLRKRYPSLGRGSIQFLQPDNRKVLAFLRQYQDETILVVANLSRFAQFVELDLSAFKGKRPVEFFGQTGFPLIGDLPYLLTLGPHTFLWFLLEKVESAASTTPFASVRTFPTLTVESWETLITGESIALLEDSLPAFLKGQRWYGGKARRIRRVRIIESLSVSDESYRSYLLFLQVEYLDGSPDVYQLPITFATGERAAQLREQTPQFVIAAVKEPERDGVLFDAIADKPFCERLLQTMEERKTLPGVAGEGLGSVTSAFQKIIGPEKAPFEMALGKGEQSNTSVILNGKLILKLYRRLHDGINPDVEIGAFLGDRFSHTAELAGVLGYRRGNDESVTLGMLQAFVPNQGTAWSYFEDQAENFLEGVLAQKDPINKDATLPNRPLTQLAAEEIPAVVTRLIGPSLESVRLLGQRTGELHAALSSDKEDPTFTPEAFTSLYQRSLYQSMRNLTGDIFSQLKKVQNNLDPQFKPLAVQVLGFQQRALDFFQQIVKMKTTAPRMRVHGDYHLGQVLYTGKDFVIIDFEGEPLHSLGERRLKRNPLRDVAGMLRSFHYVSQTAVINQTTRGIITEEKRAVAVQWARFWTLWASVTFLKAYLATTQPLGILPVDAAETEFLLNVYLLEKSIYELGYEINNRPAWARIPLEAIVQILSHEQ